VDGSLCRLVLELYTSLWAGEAFSTPIRCGYGIEHLRPFSFGIVERKHDTILRFNFVAAESDDVVKMYSTAGMVSSVFSSYLFSIYIKLLPSLLLHNPHFPCGGLLCLRSYNADMQDWVTTFYLLLTSLIRYKYVRYIELD
jgi:hypothetical protein